jgi:hypothetical protein
MDFPVIRIDKRMARLHDPVRCFSRRGRVAGQMQLGRDMISRMPWCRRISYAWRVARGTSIYKPLLRRHRVIFIHVPKTGGQSVEQALFGRPLYLGHFRLVRYEKESPENFKSFYKFAFVRNPYTRMLSAYRYLMAHSNWPEDIEFRDRTLSRYRDFENFIVNGLRQNQAIGRYPHFRPQIFQLKNSAGAIGVDFIGRFENLREDYETIRQRLGFGDPLPWLNRSQPLASGSHDCFSGQTAAIVWEFYKEDFEAFGYDALQPQSVKLGQQRNP